MTEKAAPAPRRGRPRKEPAAERAVTGAAREQILAAALTVFSKHAYEGTSLQEIAQIANVGQPLLHYHFGNKENLWRAAVDYALHDLKIVYDTVSATTVDLEPLDVLRVLCRSFLSFNARYPEHVLIMINEMRTPGERFQWMLEKYLRPIHNHLDSLLLRAQDGGYIKKIPVAYLTNTIFISLAHFFTIGPMLEAIYDADVTDPKAIEAHANYTMDILFNGILSPA